MIQAKEELLLALRNALSRLAPEASAEVAFASPKHSEHGDLAITAAMGLAKTLRRAPREIAKSLVDALHAEPAVQRWVEALDIAGPGFVNLRLKPSARQRIVREVLAAAHAFGQRAPHGSRVMVEFVSANPTGPLHVGHGRNAALGDCVCNLLQTQGWSVTREFYYNDAGVQIATLGTSVQARLSGLRPGDADWPEAAYNGEYVADIATDFLARKTVRADDREVTASGNVDDLDDITRFAVAYLRHEQDLDLRAFGVRFDTYYLESSLYSDGRVERTVAQLVAAGRTYERDGALWLRSTDYGDDKDRVMRKSDGNYTYFVPDVAYHVSKWERGFSKVINVQGSDHHGTVARVRAGLQASGVGIPAGYPDYVLYKMITVMKGGQEVKLGKRAGGYVTLRELIEWTSCDSVRFFLVSRKADTEFVFDIDLALKRNDENPVFYVQYAHARICSVLALWRDRARRAGLRGQRRRVGPPHRTHRNRFDAHTGALSRCADPRRRRICAARPRVLSARGGGELSHVLCVRTFSGRRPCPGTRAHGPADCHAAGAAQRIRRARHFGAHQHESRRRGGVSMSRHGRPRANSWQAGQRAAPKGPP